MVKKRFLVPFLGVIGVTKQALNSYECLKILQSYDFNIKTVVKIEFFLQIPTYDLYIQFI